jgi:DNA-directed RNA polymerase specialized sigma24 family protein
MLKIIEINHPIIEPLLKKTDRELLAEFQTDRRKEKFLVAIFCLYGQIIYRLTNDAGRSPQIANYLFTKTWERIEQELRSVPINTVNSLQNLLIDITGVVINSFTSEELETGVFTDKSANKSDPQNPVSPIFLCYLHQTLDRLPSDLRLVLVLAYTWQWSSSRIAAYLQSEGESIDNIDRLISKAEFEIVRLLPLDIQEIYLSSN